MYIDQISVFLENKPGELSAFVHLLAENGVDLEALSIAETQDYGLVRIIVDKPAETEALLRDKGFPCKVTKVLAVTVPDEPGSLTNILAALTDGGISIAYSYAFFSRIQGKASVILRVDDSDRAVALLADAGITG